LENTFSEVGRKGPPELMGELAPNQTARPVAQSLLVYDHTLGPAPAAGTSAVERRRHLVEDQEQLAKESLEYLAEENKESAVAPVVEETSVHLNDAATPLKSNLTPPARGVGSIEGVSKARMALLQEQGVHSCHRQPI
jgi:hypothetical protein